MSTHRNRTTYIWIGLLCIGVLFQTVLFLYSIREGAVRRDQDRRQIQQNAETIRALCDRGYTIADMNSAAVDLVSKNNFKGKGEFIRKYNLYYFQVLDELTRIDSQCVAR
jgi:hypothetical protein